MLLKVILNKKELDISDEILILDNQENNILKRKGRLENVPIPLLVWPHLLTKSLMKNFIFCAV